MFNNINVPRAVFSVHSNVGLYMYMHMYGTTCADMYAHARGWGLLAKVFGIWDSFLCYHGEDWQGLKDANTPHPPHTHSHSHTHIKTVMWEIINKMNGPLHKDMNPRNEVTSCNLISPRGVCWRDSTIQINVNCRCRVASMYVHAQCTLFNWSMKHMYVHTYTLVLLPTQQIPLRKHSPEMRTPRPINQNNYVYLYFKQPKDVHVHVHVS